MVGSPRLPTASAGSGSGDSSGGSAGVSGTHGVDRPFDDASAATAAANVMGLYLPNPSTHPRFVRATSTGKASRFQVNLWIKKVLIRLSQDARILPIASSTGSVEQGIFDSFLTFLGENGTTEKVEGSTELWFYNANGEEVCADVSLFYDATECKPRQIGRALADRIGLLAVETSVTYQWGKKRGIKDMDRRISHDCADYMTKLNEHEHEVIAKAKSAAIASAPVTRALNPTAAALLAGLEQWSAGGASAGTSSLGRLGGFLKQ
jgi:hypothetical protein